MYKRQGLVGADGATHAGAFDITYLSTLPNFIVMAASDEAELVRMVNTSVNINNQPCAFRYPRGNGAGLELPDINEKIDIGKGRVIREGKKVALVSFGNRLKECLLAEEGLKKMGINPTIIDARFVKPLDENLILPLANRIKKVVTMEEGTLIGGFGSAIVELFNDKEVNIPVYRIGIPDVLVDHASPDQSKEKLGLMPDQMADKIVKKFKLDN